MAAPDPTLPERKYGVAGVVVLGSAVLVYVLGVVPAHVGAGQAEALAGNHAAIQAALAAPGGPVTRGRVTAAEREQQRLAAEVERVAGVLRARDAALEQFFEGYTGRRDMHKTSAFKALYDSHAAKLREDAVSQAARDGNEQPVQPFAFHAWEMAPSNVEVELAQKEFWIQREVLAVAKALGADVKLVAVTVDTLPQDVARPLAARLPALLPADEAAAGAAWVWIPFEVVAEMPGARVGAFLAAWCKTPERDLCTEIRGFRLEPVGTVPEFIDVTHLPGESPESKVDLEAMERAVRVTLKLAALDPPTSRRGGA